MPRCVLTTLVLLCGWSASAADPTRVFAPTDNRLGPPVTLNGYFPFVSTVHGGIWNERRKSVQEQTLVALGLWPMPEKTPLNPVVHGKIDRDNYTIEKVFFASVPGHYVSGNLYRPKGRAGKLAGVLCPHGHWRDGRFYDAGDKEAVSQMKQGAEKTMEGAHYPLQARCAQLARMGCVVFHYDMVGYADSQQIKHREGFLDAEAELRLQNFMGLQTWNSIRALDFLLGLPEVDAKRIGVTGASGGGTQTFILGAIDDRPTVAFPAVMVSTAMQGGCICENCSYLRQNTGNIELAALFAPRPLAMSGADDWTIDIETKGLPQLKHIYRVLRGEDNVMARCYPQFKHNYNQVSRELMYNWFNKHLALQQQEPIAEKPFVPVPPKELSVYNAEHPLPSDAVDAVGLRKTLTALSDKQLAALTPKDGKSLEASRSLIGTALRVMVHDTLPPSDEVDAKTVGAQAIDKVRCEKLILGRYGQSEQVPAVLLRGPQSGDTVVVWVHPNGKSSLMRDGQLVPDAQKLLAAKATLLAIDAFGTGEFGTVTTQPVDQRFAGYTYGYNRPLLANRVHDVLTAVAYAKGLPGVKSVHLIGFEKAGPWALLARGLCGNNVTRTAVDMNQFRFAKITTTADEMMLPGALKYGDVPAFAALCAPNELLLANAGGAMDATKVAYRAANAADRLHESDKPALVEWLLR
jgi:hypothetical protein